MEGKGSGCPHLDVIGVLIERVEPHVVVIACNTASTIALTQLREAYKLPFVGTCRRSSLRRPRRKSGIIGVLATPGNGEPRIHPRADSYLCYHCKVFLHGARRLAEIAENKLKGRGIDLDELRREIGPVFRKRDGRRTDVVWCRDARITAAGG